jgi:hypothetical protein
VRDRNGRVFAALAVCVAVLGLALWLAGDRAAAPGDAADAALRVVEARLASLERRLGALERVPAHAAVNDPVAQGTGDGEAGVRARLLALETELLELRLERERASETGAADAGAPASTAAGVLSGGAGSAVTEQVLAAVDERIDQAVEEKAEELERKRNKKPSLDAVAEELALDPYQREVVEREVRQGQHQIRAILETPTADGSNLLDGLVEAMACSEAKRPDAGARWAAWIGRVMTETVPGTDQTYAARAEAVKASVREAFRRELTDDQYIEFEAWAFDPTEMEGISDSAWADLEGRVEERARLMAEVR